MPDRLTRRETECLQLLANGLRNQQIASELGIEPPTVAMHLQSTRRKLGAHTREHAVAIGVERGLVKIDAAKIGQKADTDALGRRLCLATTCVCEQGWSAELLMLVA